MFYDTKMGVKRNHCKISFFSQIKRKVKKNNFSKKNENTITIYLNLSILTVVMYLLFEILKTGRNISTLFSARTK